MLDPQALRKDFPILAQKIHHQPLTYLDNAATSQKPQVVIDAITEYYQKQNANVHRGVHHLSDVSTKVWENSRQTIADFFGAAADELIITRNATEGLNGVAYGWADYHLTEGDVILTALMEHHANLVTWQQVAARTGAKLEFIRVDQTGRLDLVDLAEKLKKHGRRLKLLALVHVSNALGTVNPIARIMEQVDAAYKKTDRPRIVIDGAQSAPHMSINFHKLRADFYVFSGHKMLGPMGIGGLIVRKELLESGEMRPWLFGGGMIDTVKTDQTVFNQDLAERFTAGTPDVASAAGLAAACTYLQNLGMKQVADHDRSLVLYTISQLQTLKNIQIIGPVSAAPGEKLDRLGSVSFIYQGVHAHDVAQVLDSQGVAVRSGHHCTMPLHLHFEWQATTRASFQVYNTKEDIDQLVIGLKKVAKTFS